MSKRIVLQKGHANIQKNSIVDLRSGTGAPGEQEFTADICERVSGRLRDHGFSVLITDANANDNSTVTDPDWDLFLSIHYDANIYDDSGGFIDWPDPSADQVNKESIRIAKAIEGQYFPYTGIKNIHQRSNANTKFYYMWQYLSAKTPCALLECGVGMGKPKDYDLCHGDRSLIVEGITKGVCKAFEVAYREMTTECEKKLKDMTKNKNEWKEKCRQERKERKLIEKERDGEKASKERAIELSTEFETKYNDCKDQIAAANTEADGWERAYNRLNETDIPEYKNRIQELELKVTALKENKYTVFESVGHVFSSIWGWRWKS